MNRIHLIVAGTLLALFAGIAGHRLWTGAEPAEAQGSVRPTGKNADVVRFWQLHREAGAERTAGNYVRAIRLYEEALELDPHHEDVLYYLSNGYLEVGRFEEAERTLERLTEAYPENARGRARRGELHLCYAAAPAFNPERAGAEFTRAIRLNQEETGPMLRRAQAALVLEDLDVARRWFDAVVATNESSVGAHHLLGYVSWESSDLDRAEMHFREAVRQARAQNGADDPVIGEGDRKDGTGMRPGDQQTCPAMDRLLDAVFVLPGHTGMKDNLDAVYEGVDAQLAVLRSHAK